MALDLEPISGSQLDLEPVESSQLSLEPAQPNETTSTVAPLTAQQSNEARLGHLAIAPSIPIPAFLEDYLVRAGRRLSAGNEAFYNIPESAKNLVTGGGQGRLDAALRLLQGVTYPIAAPIMAGVEAPVEQAVAGFGAPEHVAQTVGDFSSVPLSVLMGRASNAGKLGTAGEDIAKYLLGVGNHETPQAAPTRASEVPLNEVVPEAQIPPTRPGVTPSEEELFNTLLNVPAKREYEKVYAPDLVTPNDTRNIYDKVRSGNRFDPEAAAEATANGKPYLGKFGGYDLAPDLVREQPTVEHLIQMKREYDPQDLVERSIRDNRIQKVLGEAAGEASTPGGPNAIYTGNAPGYVGTKETQRVLTDVEANSSPGHAPGYVSNPIVERVTDKVAKNVLQIPAEIADVAAASSKPPSRARIALKYLAQNAADMVSSFGGAGRQLAQRVTAALFEAETQRDGMLHGPVGGLDVANKLKLTNEERLNVTDVLQGLAQPINERVRTLANVVRPQLDQIGHATEQSGLEIRNPVTGEVRPFVMRENYVPHYTDFEAARSNPNWRVEALQQIQEQLHRAGKDASLGEAGRILDQMIKNSRQEYGHLENARVSNLPYNRDFMYWYPRYITDATKRLAQAKQFGARYELADQLIELVGKEAGSDTYRKIAKSYFDRNSGREVLGPGSDIIAGINSAVLPLQAFFKLGTAVIMNYPQRLYPAFMGGYSNLVKAWRQARTEQGQEFGRLAGAATEQTMRDIYDMTMGADRDNALARVSRRLGSETLTRTGFTSVETMNRTIAANYGQIWAKEMLGQLGTAQGRKAEMLRRQMRQLGIEPMQALQRGMLTPEELIGAGRKMIELTQFKPNANTLPLGVTHPLGQLLFQFSSFAFKSGKFIYDQVLREAARGNMKPFLTFALTAPVVGEAVGDIKSLVTGAERPSNALARIANNYANMGTLGLWYDAIQSAQYGEIGTARRLLGPTVTDVNAMASAILSGNGRAVGQELTQNIPVIGPRLRRAIYPPKKKGNE